MKPHYQAMSLPQAIAVIRADLKARSKAAIDTNKAGDLRPLFSLAYALEAAYPEHSANNTTPARTDTSEPEKILP